MGAKVEAQLRRGPEALTLLSFSPGEGLYHARAWDENLTRRSQAALLMLKKLKGPQNLSP